VRPFCRMTMLESINPLYSLSGLFVGMLVGLTGVGGGSLMTPVLIIFFGVNPAVAVGTDLLYASATKSAGTMAHGLAKNVDWRIVRNLALGSVPGTLITIYWLADLGIGDPTINGLITVILGLALFITSVALVLRARILAFAYTHLGDLDHRRTFALTVITGAVLGVLVSITSVGAGALGVTALILLYPNLPMLRIVGSDIAHAVPLTLLAGLGHWHLGSIDWMLLLSLLVGSVPGILLGSYAATRVRESVIRYLLAAVLALVAARLLFA